MTEPTGPERLASTEQLRVRLGKSSYSAKDLLRAEAVLDDVSALARSEGREWPNAAVAGADVVAVVLSASMRAFNNPNMYVSRAAGVFNHRVHDSAFATGTFTKAELDILARARRKAGRSAGLWTQATTKGDDGFPTGFVPVEGSSEPFPVYAEDDPFNAYGDHYPGGYR
ncbi:hypothetical protein [Rhodococcus qingshengii]|uniref:hypothetical protein n=1 Tax=Rhodococcus qingshengii TaxID=334542 RepID=UPI002AFE53CC|nr:hypothetical protein [Rhodococcus qingshengii]MEA1795118.1 hypothetical protein [Rhodococcus qingshengii]